MGGKVNLTFCSWIWIKSLRLKFHDWCFANLPKVQRTLVDKSIEFSLALFGLVPPLQVEMAASHRLERPLSPQRLVGAICSRLLVALVWSTWAQVEPAGCLSCFRFLGEKNVFCGLLEENKFLRCSWGEKCRNLIANWAAAIHLNGWRLPAKATLPKEPPLLRGTTWIGGLSRPLRGVSKGHRSIKPSWHRLLSRLTHLLIFQHTWP